VSVSRWFTGRGGLLRQHDFRHLWAADVVSQFGTRVSYLALPLLAVSYLHAGTIDVALLRTAQTIAYLVLGLQVGAWSDRMRRGPIVVAADLGRAAAFAWIPVGAALGVLTMWQVYVVVAVAGVLTVFFDVARRSWLAHLVAAPDLVEANTKLATNMSVAAIASPALGGVLVQWLGAPVAITVDAASYLWSGLWLRGIRAAEATPDTPERRHLVREIGEGLRLVFGDPILRAFSLHDACVSLCQAMNTAVIIVFLVREVHLSAGVIGALGTAGLLGAIAASALTRRVAERVGQARLLWIVGIGCGVGFLIDPLTAPGWRLVFAVASTFLASVAIIVINIVESSYQQAVCPPRLRGRMNATVSFLTWGMIPLGSILGGVAGSVFGLRPALWIAGGGALASAAWLVCSPLRSRRDLPSVPTGPSSGTAPAAIG
jgi:MFS family permease